MLGTVLSTSHVLTSFILLLFYSDETEEKLRHNKAGASSDKGRAVRSGKWREMEAPLEGLLLKGALEGQPRQVGPCRAGTAPQDPPPSRTWGSQSCQSLLLLSAV